MITSYKVVVDSFYQAKNKSVDIDNLDHTAVYFLESFKIDYDILKPEGNSAIIELVSRGSKYISPSVDFAGGNIVSVFCDDVRLYVGYIDKITVVKSFKGTSISLFVNSLLMSWMKQITVNSYQEAVILGKENTLSNYQSNKVKISDILNWFTNESVLGYAARKVLKTPSVELPYVFRNGSENSLTLNSEVWFYANSSKSRMNAILEALQPYQRLIYQSPDGTINIEPMSLEDYKGSKTNYTFNLSSNNITSDFTHWKNYSYLNGSADVYNRTYSTCMPIGINIAGEPGSSAVVAVSTPESPGNVFSRPLELLKSKQFEQSVAYNCDISSAMLTDPSLLTYLSAGGKGLTSSLSENVPANAPSVPKLYSEIAMARSMFSAEQLSISLPYSRYAPNTIPLGRSISVEAPFLFDNNVWYCYGCQLSLSSAEGTVMDLNLCRQYTHNSYWTDKVS